MIDRVLDFSERPARLSIKNSNLKVESELGTITVPCDEIAVIVIAHRQVTFTSAVIGELADAGAMLVTCDKRFMPAAMMLPLQTNHVQAQRFRFQVALTAPKRKRLWQAIVRAKVRSQARILKEITGSDIGLGALIPRVQSGDKSNIEARAARGYWLQLFGTDFVRSNPDDPRNALLNYGYAVLRAIVARAICASGLHPSFPLFHSNVHNPFGLADDLMEPFRPLVDRRVFYLCGARTDQQVSLDSATKHELLTDLVGTLHFKTEQRRLPDAVHRLTSSLVSVLSGERTDLWLPEWIKKEPEKAL
jgi:CRISPR-associated protein Cas1